MTEVKSPRATDVENPSGFSMRKVPSHEQPGLSQGRIPRGMAMEQKRHSSRDKGDSRWG